jgi:hypothetical protein
VNAALLGWLIARLVRLVEEPARVRWALALLLAATAPARTLTQFSLLSFALAMGGLFSSSRAAGALCVGLSLMKPQVGGVALVWWLLRREWSRAGLALAVPLVLAGVFAAHADVGPLTLANQYADVLRLVYAGAEPFRGHTELGASSLLASAALAVVLLLPAIAFAARARAWTRDEGLELLALCGAVSLLAMRHLSYDLILLWPALLAWRVPPFSVRRAASGWAAAFALIAVLLVAEIPGWVRLAVSWGAPSSILALTEIDRGLAIAAWLALAWYLWFARRRHPGI